MSCEQEKNRNLFLEALFNNSLEAIVRMDAEYRVVDINTAFEKLFGYRLLEIKGLPLDDVIDMGQTGTADRSITARVLQGEQTITEGVRYNRYGQPLELLIKGIPININGKMTGAFGIYADISERKKAERELQIERWRLENIIEGSNVGTWEWNIQTGEAIYNEGWAAILGYTPGELSALGNRVFETLAHPEDLQRSNELLEKHFAGELAFYDFECRMKHKSGSWVWVHDRGKVVTHTADGKPLWMFGTHTDITERKKNEEQIKYISFHDRLTDLYNRYYLDEEMSRLESSRNLPITIIIADLNGLKLVNDTYGHEIGDTLLRSAGRILKVVCRQDDIIARWGGDEFVILLPGTTTDEAWAICRRIADRCREVFIEELPLSMALGVASKNDSQTRLVETLRQAENSMYKQKLTESRSTKNAVLKALLKTLEAKSFETEAHTQRMQKIARAIGEKTGLSDAELSRLNLLITLHDIGKINIAEEILTKKGPLTAEEWNEIKRHPEIGYRIARATEEFAHVADDILAHHENWDGTGYPRGLKMYNIPLLARITALADAYEVMANGRPYKRAMSENEIAAEFKRCAGKQFDPTLVDTLLALDLSEV